MLPQSSHALQQRSKDIIAAYGQREQFLASFNPDMQRIVANDSALCYFGDIPTLSQINEAYGRHTAVMWLVPQLYDLSEYCGCREKLQGKPLEQCADIIASEYHYLKVTELMLFFHRFKVGKYGRFYGSVDPLVITTALRDFITERAIAYETHENQQNQARMEEYKAKAISYEEYKQRRNNNENNN